jgi:DNA (cytosine-5)-methyltransferase 1
MQMCYLIYVTSIRKRLRNEMAAYYNEIEPYAAQWLRNLIAKNLIAPGDVDERSIVDVRPDDLKGYTQCHFFAGIGGWSVALRLAGWPDERPVWTGSCPCQPFSNAGNRKGKEDERHLWPIWYELIKDRKPTIIFGEQVDRAIAFGWIDDVYEGLEKEGYAFGFAVLPASAGERGHSRERIFFVGNSEYDGQPAAEEQRGNGTPIHAWQKKQDNTGKSTGTSDIQPLANSDDQGLQRWDKLPERAGERIAWTNSMELLRCPDGKFRPVEPGVAVLADGIPKGMAKIVSRGFGNAIVPQVAAEFIKAVM